MCVLSLPFSEAFLTNNYFPSPLHRASPARMNAERKKTRISTPFFLRGAPDVLMRPCDLDKSCLLPPLSVEQLDNNVGKCRDLFPWKKNDYYAEMKY